MILVSRILWILPPVRQYKTQYFYFFLFLALQDVFGFVIRNIVHSRTNIHFLLLGLCSIFSLFTLKQLRENLIWAAFLTMIFVSSMILKTDQIADIYLLILTQMIVLAVILKRAVVFIIENKKINLFYLVFVLYVMLQLTRFFNVVLYFTDAKYFYNITTLLEYGIAVFFIVFTVKSKKIIYNIKYLQNLEY